MNMIVENSRVMWRTGYYSAYHTLLCTRNIYDNTFYVNDLKKGNDGFNLYNSE
jgi:hypothetical protein